MTACLGSSAWPLTRSEPNRKGPRYIHYIVYVDEPKGKWGIELRESLPCYRGGSRTQLGQQCADSVAGELRGVKRRGRKAPERLRDLLGRDGTGVCRGFPGEQFRQQRRARNRGDAAARAEPRLGNSPRLDADGELEDVAANGILHGDGRGGSGERAGVAGILEMVEDGGAVHARSISPNSAWRKRSSLGAL